MEDSATRLRIGSKDPGGCELPICGRAVGGGQPRLTENLRAVVEGELDAAGTTLLFVKR